MKLLTLSSLAHHSNHSLLSWFVVLQDSLINKDDKKSQKSHSKNKKLNKETNESRTKATLGQWQVGAFCRAIFTEDNHEYEATVIKIDLDKRLCTVRFAGYLNEEEVSVDDIVLSKGRKSRHLQERLAQGEQVRLFLINFLKNKMYRSDVSQMLFPLQQNGLDVIDMEWNENNEEEKSSDNNFNQRHRNYGKCKSQNFNKPLVGIVHNFLIF